MPLPEATTFQRWALRLCVALPLLMLAANVLAWLRWGFDLPFVDDWRPYRDQRALSFALTDLFQPVNNTISPVGIFLDRVAQRLFDGDAVPYQTISMLGVLGGLLALQWQLLGWVLRGRTVALAACFAFTAFMLQSGSYWGEQSLAYHQALPLVALLSAASLNLRSGSHVVWRSAAIFTLGVIAGLSYISGAVGALVMGSVWIALAWWGGTRTPTALRRRALHGGTALIVAGFVTTTVQIWITRTPGSDPIGQRMILTSPFGLDFWAYLAGKVGRATGRAFAATGIELGWTAMLLLLLIAATVWALRSLGCARGRRVAWVLLPLLAIVVAYLGLVSLGRAGYRSPGVQGFGAVFMSAYPRFHYFWATLLLPWIPAAAVAACRGRDRFLHLLGFTALVAALALGGVRGIFDISAAYRHSAAFRSAQLRCLQEQLGAGRPIVCPSFDLIGITDWTDSYLYARSIGASFVRNLQILPHDGWGPAFFDWSDPRARAAVRWARDGSTSVLQLPLAPRDGLDATGCSVLGVRMVVGGATAGTATLRFRRAVGAADAAPEELKRRVLPDGDGRAWIEFVARSDSGFAPAAQVVLPGGVDPTQVVGMWASCRLRARGAGR